MSKDILIQLGGLLPWTVAQEYISVFFGGGGGTPAAYGGFQARGQIGAGAASLHHSHSNARSEWCLQPTPQLMAAPDP